MPRLRRQERFAREEYALSPRTRGGRLLGRPAPGRGTPIASGAGAPGVGLPPQPREARRPAASRWIRRAVLDTVPRRPRASSSLRLRHVLLPSRSSALVRGDTPSSAVVGHGRSCRCSRVAGGPHVMMTDRAAATGLPRRDECVRAAASAAVARPAASATFGTRLYVLVVTGHSSRRMRCSARTPIRGLRERVERTRPGCGHPHASDNSRRRAYGLPPLRLCRASVASASTSAST